VIESTRVLPAIAAATVTAVPAAVTRRAGDLLFGDIDLEGATIKLGAIEGALGLLSFFGRSHLHESKAFGASRVAVGDEVDRGYLSVGLEESPKAGFRGFIAEVSHIQFCRVHCSLHGRSYVATDERERLETKAKRLEDSALGLKQFPDEWASAL
jgi:hypothetical protein